MKKSDCLVVFFGVSLTFLLLLCCTICFAQNLTKGSNQGCKDAIYVPGVVMGCGATAWDMVSGGCRGTSGIEANRLPGGCAQTEVQCSCSPQGGEPNPYHLMSCECWPN